MLSGADPRGGGHGSDGPPKYHETKKKIIIFKNYIFL